MILPWLIFSFPGTNNKEFELWHRRYGHLNYRSLGHRVGCKVNVDKFKRCEVCVNSEQTVLPFTQRNFRRSKRCFELIHSDIVGPVNITGRKGEKFILHFIDDFSGFKVSYPMKRKSDTLEFFREYVTFVKSLSSSCNYIGTLRVDNAGEYTAYNFRQYCLGQNIRIQFAPPLCH